MSLEYDFHVKGLTPNYRILYIHFHSIYLKIIVWQFKDTKGAILVISLFLCDKLF